MLEKGRWHHTRGYSVHTRLRQLSTALPVAKIWRRYKFGRVHVRLGYTSWIGAESKMELEWAGPWEISCNALESPVDILEPYPLWPIWNFSGQVP